MKRENLVLSDQLIKIELPSQKIREADVSSVSPLPFALRRANGRAVGFPNLSRW